MLDWLEEWLQTEWPELDVHCTSVTEQWTTIAVVGPKSRAVIAKLAPELAADGGLDAEAFPFMTFSETTLASGSRPGSAGSRSPANWPTKSTSRPGTG